MFGLVTSAALLAAAPAAAQTMEATGLLKRAAAVMGDPASIRYVAQGDGYTFGQAHVPGGAWPRINVHNQTRTINYATGAMRETITLSRAEPKGGGGYPLAGQQTNDQYVAGNFAWNVAGGNPAAGSRFVSERNHQLWTTPHGIIKSALRNNATLDFQNRGGKSMAAVRFTEPGRFAATAWFNDKFQVERVESRYPDAVLGEATAVTTYSEYETHGPVQFPGRIEQSSEGHRTLSVIVTEVVANAAAEIPVPDAVAKATERVTAAKVTDGVWFIAGGSHNSVAIEMKDHMVLVEAPLSDMRTKPVIDEVRKLSKKPLRYVINSHHHFDHAGGLRAAAAEGLTIITQAGNRAYLEKALANRGRIAPDLLTKSGRKATLRTVADKMVHSDGTRSLELHRIKDSVHNDTFLMVYLPKEKILIEADAYTPGAPGAKPPAAPNNANAVNLVQNVQRLKLAVDTVLPLHGRIAKGEEMMAAGK
jgi:glyoxylase-like metal-dependent hydrolase (beta-lactamase superfamily II)